MQPLTEQRKANHGFHCEGRTEKRRKDGGRRSEDISFAEIWNSIIQCKMKVMYAYGT